MIPLGEWLPDQPPLNNPGVLVAKNCLPHAAGFLPMPAEEVYSTALDEYCRGAIFCRDASANVYVLAGDKSKLQLLSTTLGWTDISSATYASGAATTYSERWEFVQWGGDVFATNYHDPVQSFTLGASTATALGGSPLQARHIATARNFVFLADVQDNGGGNPNPTKIAWSALNDPTSWTASAATQADSETLRGSGGPIQRVFGGEYVIVFQEKAIWRMEYAGPPTVWQFDEIEPSIGLIAPGAAALASQDIYFLSERGFMVLRSGSRVEPIGAEKVDRFVLDDIDRTNLHRMSCVADSETHRVYWAYPAETNTGGLCNRLIVYDFAIGRWSYSEQDTEQILIAATPAYTLEGLDSVSTDLDALPVSLDDPAWNGGVSQLAKFDGDHKLSFFSGAAMAAQFEPRELQITPGRRTLLTAVRPLIDGGAVTVEIGCRQSQGDSVNWLPAAPVNTNGRATRRKNARYHRLRLNVSGNWTHAQGFEVAGDAVGGR